MPRIFNAAVLTLGGFAPLALAASSPADVIVRGPLGGQIVAPAPVTVRVGTGVIVSAPSRLPVSAKTASAPVIVSKPAPVIRPDDDEPLPPPTVLSSGTGPAAPLAAKVLAVSPRDFAKTFKVGLNPGRYEVLFVHPISHKAIAVPFELPPGNPRVSYCCNTLVFDYGRHEVEVRFQLGNKVKVVQR